MTLRIEHHASRTRPQTIRRSALTVLAAADTWMPSPELARRVGCRTASLVTSLVPAITSGEVERRGERGANYYRILKIRPRVEGYTSPWDMIDRWKAAHG